MQKSQPDSKSRLFAKGRENTRLLRDIDDEMDFYGEDIAFFAECNANSQPPGDSRELRDSNLVRKDGPRRY